MWIKLSVTETLLVLYLNFLVSREDLVKKSHIPLVDLNTILVDHLGRILLWPLLPKILHLEVIDTNVTKVNFPSSYVIVTTFTAFP